MGYRSERLYNGLHLMYIGNLIAVSSVLITLVMLFIPALLVLALLASLIALVGGIMSVVGLAQLRNEHQDYMMALIAWVVNVVCNLISKNTTGGVSAITSVASTICCLLQMYFTIRATNGFLSQIGREDLIAKGKTVMNVEYVSVLATVVLTILGVVMVMAGGVTLFGIATAVVLVISIAVLVLYLIYLKDSSEALRRLSSW